MFSKFSTAAFFAIYKYNLQSYHRFRRAKQEHTTCSLKKMGFSKPSPAALLRMNKTASTIFVVFVIYRYNLLPYHRLRRAK